MLTFAAGEKVFQLTDLSKDNMKVTGLVGADV